SGMGRPDPFQAQSAKKIWWLGGKDPLLGGVLAHRGAPPVGTHGDPPGRRKPPAALSRAEDVSRASAAAGAPRHRPAAPAARDEAVRDRDRERRGVRHLREKGPGHPAPLGPRVRREKKIIFFSAGGDDQSAGGDPGRRERDPLRRPARLALPRPEGLPAHFPLIASSSTSNTSVAPPGIDGGWP